MTELKAAVIDIGTNSCRLLVGAKNNKSQIKTLKREVEVTRLGEGVDQNKKLKIAAVKRVEQVLKRYQKIIVDLGVEKLRVIGTSALRDVENPELLAQKIAGLGFELEIISGRREAELNYLGAALKQDSNFLLIDIGGGSTEFIWPQGAELNFKSLDIGCVRMTERFISDPEAEFKAAETAALKAYLQKLFKKELELADNYNLKGVGGTLTSLAAVKLGLEDYDSQQIENSKVSLKELTDLTAELAELNLAERKKIKGLQPERADIIITGLIILKEILVYTAAEEIKVSDHDLLYGILKEELQI